MDFKFLLDINLLTFLLVFVIFGIWELVKYIYRKNTGKEIDPRIVTTTNGAVSIFYSVLVVTADSLNLLYLIFTNALQYFLIGVR